MQGKGYSLNVPLVQGIDTEQYLALFKPIIRCAARLAHLGCAAMRQWSSSWGVEQRPGQPGTGPSKLCCCLWILPHEARGWLARVLVD